MSSKYNEQVIEAACEAIDWAEGLVVTDALALAVFDSLERAPWWEEVGSDYGVDFGEPFREECAGRAWERTNKDPYRPIGSSPHQGSSFRYFRDTRWTPPPAPLAVGDVIESDCEENCPTDGVGIVDALGTVAQIFDGDIMWANGGEDEWGTLFPSSHLPLTVIYVPELV